MMQQKIEDIILWRSIHVHAEVWLCRYGYRCDILVVSCLCDYLRLGLPNKNN